MDALLFRLLTILVMAGGLRAAEMPLAVPWAADGTFALPLEALSEDRAANAVTTAVPGIVGAEKAPDGSRVVRIALRQTPTGHEALRVGWMTCGKGGFAPPRITLVDPLPALVDPRSGNPAVEPLELKPPVAVDGRLGAGERRWYRLQLRRDETLALEVVSRRVGSTLDPRVVVVGPDGRTILDEDDTTGADRDVAVSFRAVRTGAHIIHLSGSLDEGDAASGRFRLRVHPGEPALLPFDPGFAASLEGAIAGASDRTPTSPPFVAAGARIRGTFRHPGERLVWMIDGVKGATLGIRFEGRGAGSRADLLATVRDHEGKVVGELDATGSGDGVLSVKFARSGHHMLEVSELGRGFGPGYFFGAALDAGSPAIDLTLDKNQLEVTPGGKAELKVTVTRRDYTGPVSLKLEGLPEGFGLEPETLDGKAKDATIRILAPTNAPTTDAWRVRLLGTPTALTNVPPVVAGTRTPVLDQWPTLHQPPTVWNGVVLLRWKP